MRRVMTGAAVLIVLATMTAPAAAQASNGDTIGNRVFLKLEGIDGLSTVVTDFFDIDAYEFEVAEVGNGAPEPSALTLLKRADYSTPLLMQRALESTVIPTAEIRFFNDFGGGLVHLFTVGLTNIRVLGVKNMRLSAVEPAFSDLETLQELTLSFETITWTSVDGGAPAQPSYSFTVGGTP